jgi:uncharacterized protein YuzE
MKLYELKIEDENVDEVMAISLVESPAIESDFIYFHNEQVMFTSVSDEKRILLGPILIPDKKILRVDAAGEPYEVYFTKETVAKLAQNYLMKGYQKKATLEHDSKIDDVTLVESWVKESKLNDKSNMYGLNLPVGTWVGMFKINNDKIWNDYVKNGKVKGFSIEGAFEHQLVKASKELEILQKEITELSEVEADIVLAHIKNIIKKDRRFAKGQTLVEQSHSDYPDSVKNNAKKVLEWADKNGWGSCGTPVGKQRANQLAKGEPISVDTIKRMYSYLSRHEGDLDSSTTYSEGCGKLMYDSWGGKAALGWAHNKLKQLGEIELEGAQPSIASSYPGEGPTNKKKDYTHPALLGKKK